LVPKSIASASPDKPFKVDSVEIVNLPGMTTGEYRKPVKHGRPSDKENYNPKGYSDHLPIHLMLEERL
jgi:hypothetical protein